MGKLLVTGSAGFIGFHLCRRLLETGEQVIGVDNLNDYYDVRLKQARNAILTQHSNFQFLRLDVANRNEVAQLFRQHCFDRVVNLAAQAGVRHSLVNPHAYVDSNLVGFANVLEGCRHSHVRHLVFASSSSVYGANACMPFSVHHNVDHPVSLYAATKKANELMAHAYAHLFGLPCTGLRFFTVYGPWGRPDMALFKFTSAILSGEPIEVFNYGNLRRDFTYIDDIIEAVIRVAGQVPQPDSRWRADAPDPASSSAPYRLYNIGNNCPVELMDLIGTLEQALGRKAQLKFLPMQAGDVLATYADVDDLARAVGFRPTTPLQAGLDRFVNWYRDFYGVGARAAACAAS